MCTWSSNVGGTHFDLRPLMIDSKSNAQCPRIKDGDIPCTPEIEDSYEYVWNFCADVNRASLPPQCSAMGKTGVALQYSQDKTESFCHILAHYDDAVHKIEYKLLDSKDPTKGVSMSYPPGEQCTTASGVKSATVDVICSNTARKVVSAQEPDKCQYHMVMSSYYGCPTECPVTGNGLCDSHGHCAMDTVNHKAYCYCNEGYYGASCSSTNAPKNESYDGFSVQVGFLITLLLAALGLTGGLVYMGMQIKVFRQEQIGSYYNTLAGSEHESLENEMVDFRG
jgi:hypothetical protein